RLLRGIGIHVTATGTWDPAGPPQQTGALWFGGGWGADYPSPSDFFVPILASEAIVSNPTQGRGIGNYNDSLIGATSASLRAWGYKIQHVPSMDDRINQCLALVGQSAIDCWAYADKYVNTRIVPLVPLSFGQVTEVGTTRLAGTPIDPFTARPAVERM